MRATRVLRCTRCTGSSSGRRSAWTLGHFWDERAYLASPNAKKQLMTVAVMSALGYTSSGGTNGTIIGSDGTLQAASAPRITYDRGASSNAITYSDVWQSGTWIANVSPTDGGAGALIDGYQTARFTASGGASGYFRAIAGSPIPSGETFWVAHYVNRVSGAGTFTGGCDALGSLVFNPSTGQLTSGPAVSGVKAVAGGWLIFGKYTGNGTANSLVAFGGSAATVFDVATWVVRGASLTPYLKTGATAPLYTAGTPKSQNLASGSGTQSVTVLPGCVYSILHQSGGTYTLSGAATGTTTAGTTTTFVAATATLTLTASSTPTLLQVWEGTGTMAYVAGPYSLYYQQGLITEAARTRETLHPRDLTQAAWVKGANITVAKTATGIDGVANSCTTLTATSASLAWVYQAVYNASANRAFSLRVRARSASRVTFGISCDGGATQSYFTALPCWQTFLVTKASSTNPWYFIGLLANGDSIDVDFVQGEQYTTLPSVPPMPIWGTESAAQTKSADAIRHPSLLTDGPMTLAVRATAYNGNSGATQAIVGRSSVGLALYLNSSNGNVTMYDGVNVASVPASSPIGGVPFQAAARWSGSAMGVSVNGSSVGTGTFDGTMGSGVTGIGEDGTGLEKFAGLIGSIEIAGTAMNDATFQRAALGLVA